MSTSGSKLNEHVAHFLVDIHNIGINNNFLKTIKICSSQGNLDFVANLSLIIYNNGSKRNR